MRKRSSSTSPNTSAEASPLLGVLTALALGLAALTHAQPEPSPLPKPVVPQTASPDLALHTDLNVPQDALDKLLRGQDAGMDMRFGEAEDLIEEGKDLAPGHPLGGVFMLANMLAKIQEDLRASGGRAEVPAKFFEQVDEVLRQAEADLKAHPASPYPKIYLGAAFGCRGLANLYRGRYVTSYFDGKKGAAFLKEAVAQDPALYNAYMGLGQFEYYCGRLAGVLQFVLALRGDEKKGLEMLRICADKGTYGAWPCRAYLAKLLVSEQKQYAAAEADLITVNERYPNSYEIAGGILLSLMASAKPSPALMASGQNIFRRIEAGWAPPKHAHLPLDPGRLALAKALAANGKPSDALTHFQALLKSPDKDIAELARKSLESLPR